MPATLKAVWRNNQRILSNFFSLSILQFTNYLVPLITLPYLVRVLGPSRYGLVEFARAMTIYFVMLTDYGFTLSATREISVHRDDPKRISEIFSAIMVIRLLLLTLSFVLMGSLVLGIAKLRAEWPVYLFAFGTVVGQSLFPVWLFQGLERMKHMAILNIVARCLITVSIFIFIRQAEDYVYVPLVQSAGIIFLGVAGLVLALRVFRVRFAFPTVASLRHQITSAWHLFLSKIAITLYTTSNIVVLGLLTDPLYVGYYAAGDKIVRAVTDALHVPLSQAIFPHVGRLVSQSKVAALRFTGRVAKLVSVVTIALSAGLFVGAPYLTRIILGPGFDASVSVVRILSLLPFIVGLSNIFGTQIMVNFGLKKVLARILMVAGLLNLPIVILSVLLLKHTGVAIASLTTEIVVTTAMFAVLRKNGLNVFARFDKAVDNGQTDT